MSFASKLMNWYGEFGRDLPWRNTQDAYVIWLSEIILQQTRVEQGMPYFYAFLENFPTVKDFAEASEEDILRLWQGLGYYSRGRNMHVAANMVMNDFEGVFPTDYKSLLKLKGVGEYTAAAISSFSSNEKKAVLDGNVFRVLSRIFEIDTPINTTPGKKIFAQLAQDLIDDVNPGIYNQAIMDFGAMICKPKAPLCVECVFREECAAYENDRIDELPVKLKGKASKNRYFNYFIFEKGDEVLVSKRGEGDVWTNLYEFPLIETNLPQEIDEIIEHVDFQKYFGNASIELIGKEIKHILSHQNIYAKFYKLNNILEVNEKKDNWSYCFSDNLDKLAKHKLIFSFVNKYYNN